MPVVFFGHIVLLHLPEKWPSSDQMTGDILPKDTPQLGHGGPFEGYVDLILPSAEHLCPPSSRMTVQNHSASTRKKMLIEKTSIFYSFSLE